MNRTSNFANVILSALIALTLILAAVQVVDAHAASATNLEESRSFSPDPGNIDRFVATTGTDDSGNNTCADYFNPCATIDQAISKAQADDIIAVAEGVYEFTGQLTPGVTQYVVSINGVLIGRLSLYGGWNSDFSSQVGFSTIDGEKQVAGIRIYGGSQQPSPQIILDHFKVINGSYGGINTGFPNLIINNSAIYNNVKAGVYAHGGGIENYYGSITLNNVTVSHNRTDAEIGGAGGGIYSYGGSAILNNVTVTNNSSYDGGGVSLGTAGQSGASIIITNSLLYGNTASRLGPDCVGSVAGTADNLVGDTSDCSIFSASNGNLLNVNPQLGAFIEGVGYHPILSNSPAIDAGSNCYGTSDQRGYTRIIACDIGAYEYPDTIGSAIRLVVAEGDNQKVAPMHEFSLPLRVAALDANGSPVSGQSVQFTAPGTGASGFFPGHLTSITVTTGEDGTAGTLFTANEQRGGYQVTAELTGALPTSFALQNAAWYVANGGDDMADCASPSTACATIDAAVAKAETKDVILVASGIYTGDSIYSAAVNINKGVIVLGGWNATFDAQTGYSIVDGEGERPGISIYANNVDLDHFVVENGYSAGGGGGVGIGGDTITITNLIVRNSRAGNDGGGIAVNGIGVTITHATVYNNSAGWGGGGIAVYGFAKLTLANSTVAYNNTLGVGGGISGNADLNNVTVIGNSSLNAGGGINGAITMKNSILARNSSGVSPNCSGGVVSNGHNIIEDTSGCNFVSSTGDLTGIDSKVGTFLPSRGYAPLLPNSPAINSGAGCYGATDQRGVARVGQCDIGAYEFDPIGSPTFIEIAGGDKQRTAPSFTFSKPFSIVILDENGSPVSGVSVTFTAPASGPSGTFANGTTVDASIVSDAAGIATTSAFTANEFAGAYAVTAVSSVGALEFNVANLALYVDLSGSDSNDCLSPSSACLSINGAITKAMEGDIIFVSSETYTASGNQVVEMTKSVTIIGGWDATFSFQDGYSVLDGQSSHRGVNVPAGVTASMQNFRVQNAGWNYGIWNAGKLTLKQCDISNNDMGLYGAGVYNKGTLLIDNCNIHHNSSEGIQNEGHLTLTNTMVSDNVGEGITNRNSYGVGILIVNSSIIRNNKESGISSSGTLTVSRSTISENLAMNGAGIYADGSVTIENSTLFGNSASGPGGGIYAAGGTFLINNVTISGNSASSGGGIYQSGNGNVSVRNSILGGNTITSGTGPDCSGLISSLGANIISSNSGCMFGSGAGDQFNVDPLLGTYLPLQGYQPLLPGSPAINSGNGATCLATDQRGVARAGTCDKGSYEYVVPGPAVQIVLVAGDDQHIPLNEASAKPLQAAALDAIGSPVSGVEVTFSAPSTGPSGIFANSQTFSTVGTTNLAGIATASTYTANGELGAYVVIASSSFGSVNFNLNNLVWFVSPSGNNGNDCLTPASACANIAGAVGKVGFYSGDTVWIQKGIYDIPGVTYVDIRKSVSLAGGWNSEFAARDGVTVLKDGINIPIYGPARSKVRISQVTLDGFGIYNNGNTLILERSSIINAPSGVEIFGGNATIISSTMGNLSGNAVEVRNNGPVASPVSIIGSTIIGTVNNDAEVGTVFVASSILGNCGGDFSSNGYNIVGTAGDPNLFMCGGWLSSDIVGGATPLDLSTFINLTLTQDPASGQWHYPLVYHSVASENKTIDKVPVGSGCPETDQLGVARPEGAACDIGAVEYVYPRAMAGIYDDKASVWSYNGTWPTQKVNSAYGGSYRYSTVAGASATVYFSGVQVKLYYTKNSGMGNLNVYVDDVFVATLNQKSGAARYKQIWLSPIYPDGVHKITFARSSNKVNVDAIEVIPAPDLISPAVITDLFATTATGTSYGQVNLQWTAVGDDGNTGTVASYQIRYSTSIIDTEAKWSLATAVTSGLATPASAGTLQSMAVSGLAPSLEYYFSIRAVDDGGNLSSLSNSPSAIALSLPPVPGGYTYDNLDSHWIFSGTWTVATTAGASGGNVATSSLAGSNASLLFSGTGFTLRYYMKSGNGALAVYVDGVLKTTISQKSSTIAIVWKTYVVSGLAPGTHVIQVVDSTGKVNFDNIIIAP